MCIRIRGRGICVLGLEGLVYIRLKGTCVFLLEGHM